MADYLSDNRLMKKETIETFVKKFGSHHICNSVFIEDGNHIFYRNKLKELALAEGTDSLPFKSSDTGLSMSFNKTEDALANKII